MDAMTPFRRDPERRMIAGILGAMAPRLGIDATWLRLAAALIAVFTGGVILWAYAILWMISPLGTNGRAPLARWFGRAGRIFKGPATYPTPPDHV
jgi:phage shock protein PspC (stress-responsive transcriptional regulator)